MTIARRMGTGYAWISAACLALLAWLAYHEFVEEPAEFAAMGLTNVHKDTQAELSTVCFLALIPVLLGLGWWWMRRVLAPLKSLTAAVESMHSHNLRQPIPRSGNGDEVDKLTAVFNSMTSRLDESFRRVQEFTLHASHELKTPLTVMRMQLETAMREGQANTPDQCRYFDEQLDEVRRLTQIVDGLTLLTKADAGLVKLQQESVMLTALVQEAFDDAVILAQPRGVGVTLGQCDPVAVLGDRHRLRQLFLILTDNAVKYNRPNGTIAISLHASSGMAEVRITNTGVPPKSREAVFDRFVRGDNAQGAVEGCGLGLTIGRWIVHAHEGTIEMVPEPPDRTRVVVRIPTLTASDSSAGSSAP